jgi:hypothetical protein
VSKPLNLHLFRRMVPVGRRQTTLVRGFSTRFRLPSQTYGYLYMSDAQLSESGRVVLPSPHRAGR